MPTYPVKNSKTGEQKELMMSMKAYDAWRKDNPDWDKDWSKGVAGVGEVGDRKQKLVNRKPGWNEVLERVQKYPGAQKQKID